MAAPRLHSTGFSPFHPPTHIPPIAGGAPYHDQGLRYGRAHRVIDEQQLQWQTAWARSPPYIVRDDTLCSSPQSVLHLVHHTSPGVSDHRPFFPPPWSPPRETPVWPAEQLPFSNNSPAHCVLSLPTPPVFEAGTFPAQPPGSDVPIRLHPHLIVNPVDPSVPILQWDIIQAAELARVLGGRNLIIPLDLGAPAVTPGAKKIYITSDIPYLEYWMERWGPLIVRKIDGTDIKVRDILDAIHDYFRMPLRKVDVDELRHVPANMEMLGLSADMRIRDCYDTLPPITAMMGYRRSDALGGMRRFAGLRAVLFADRTWKVYLSLCAGPVPAFS